MDLLGDIGTADQLTSTRAENAILKEKVKALEQRCSVLTVENETLKAEVEIYRKEFAMSSTSVGGSAAAMQATGAGEEDYSKDHFVTCGNGVYAESNEVLLDKLHNISNPSCCSLSQDDTVLATGGADQNLTLCQWGAALGGDPSAVIQKKASVSCGAPVISVAFDSKLRSPFVAGGCMDGTVHVVHYSTSGGALEAKEVATGTIKHNKYVRTVAWHDNILASSSADGCVQLHKVVWNGFDESSVQLEKVKTIMLSGPVEALCFHKETLVCFARGTPHLSYFDLENFEQTKKNLNQGPGNAGFDEHVSFAVMDISGHGEYLALATDTSRNMIVEFSTGKVVRNLYGHKNDGYSQPKLAWSQSGQYLYGNTQEESVICVWDIASAEIIKKLEGHTNPIRDMYSSNSTDTFVTTSFDKKTHVWLTPA